MGTPCLPNRILNTTILTRHILYQDHSIGDVGTILLRSTLMAGCDVHQSRSKPRSRVTSREIEVACSVSVAQTPVEVACHSNLHREGRFLDHDNPHFRAA